jgi:GH18 family chitinase
LPDFRPKPNADGSCHAYYVPKDDNCSKISAANSLTNDDLEEFNKNTWAWNGCENLQYNMNICLSEGDPPMPAIVDNAVCGPQVPGTERPTDGTKLADLNPCPLNACCDVWGQCGITAEFCTDTGTGNPGTAEPGTNGCISNCGTSIVRGSAPSTFRKIAYYEGYGMARECLHQDALQIDSSKYTHLHFGFGTLTPSYDVEVGDVLSAYEFENFKRITGPQRILSFGGWAFSTEPATYNIFREGVTAANRLTMARKIADFIKKHDLDGVDIDWEYPGAPDIPGIPPGNKDDGENYLAFLVILKNLLPGKSVSIAAPSSYWYLRAYPLEKISKVVDYIIYMTYDLHGQWDAQNPNSQEGCALGNCLRSQVNLTETMSSLVMITKAGVPSGKVVVGVTSYGRSFNMAEAGCYGPECLYTGTRLQSDATKGRCTDTAGYISNAEINEIIQNGTRVTKQFVDNKSNSNILVYDDTQWVAYMDNDIKARRNQLYAGLNMGGTTDWATDLDEFHDPPRSSGSWLDFKLSIKAGKNPWQEGDRNGNWTEINCDSQAAADIRHLTPAQRWEGMDCDHAWSDIIAVWKDVDRPNSHFSFTESLSLTINGPPHADCGSLKDDNNCGQTLQCDGFQNIGSGPAGWAIWNSFVMIHEMYQSYHDALYKAAAAAINPALEDFENKFSPIPPEEDNTWLLLLLDIVTVGVSAAAAPFFNNFLAKLPYFIGKEAAAGNIKDLTMLAIGQSTTIAKDLLSTSESEWSEESQDTLSNYLGQSITAWGNITAVALERLFDGKDDSIRTLHAILDDGKLLSGGGAEIQPSPPETSEPELENNIAKAFFAYAIPSAWTFSKHYAFVIDSGYDCSAQDPLDDYLDADVMHATYGCVDNRLYYLAAPKGDSKTCHCVYTKNHCDKVCVNTHFEAPPGLESLDGKNFGGVSVQDLIQG